MSKYRITYTRRKLVHGALASWYSESTRQATLVAGSLADAVSKITTRLKKKGYEFGVVRMAEVELDCWTVLGVGEYQGLVA